MEISEITASCEKMGKNSGVVSVMLFDVKVSVNRLLIFQRMFTHIFAQFKFKFIYINENQLNLFNVRVC